MEHKIKHLVIFSLKEDIDNEEAQHFLQEGQQMLTSIPVVQDFEVLREISHQNDYQFGFAMEFANKSDFDFYLTHPFHVQFLQTRWKTQVSKFMEMNFRLN